jgi:hypothetical protein
MDVGDFLRELGLQQYEAAFRDNRIDIRVLPKLTAEDLKDLGVTLIGDRRMLLDAIAALREPTAPGARLAGMFWTPGSSGARKGPRPPKPNVARSA